MRMTRHNSRGSKNSFKGYSVKHNDREFDISKSDNIDKDRSKDNIYWTLDSEDIYRGSDKSKHPSFEDFEKGYYEKHFKNQYESQQEKHRKSRHSDRLKTFDEWRMSKRYCPEETVLQFGNIDNFKKLDKQEVILTMMEIIEAEMNFSESHNDCFEIIDFSLHTDEEGVYHLHSRRVYKYRDDDGFEKIGQNKALEQSGLPLPNPDKPIDSKNNYKVTLDKILRDNALKIAEKHGMSIIKEPEVNVKHNRSKNKMIADKTRALKKEYISKKSSLTKEIDTLTEERDVIESNLVEARETLSEAQEEAQRVKDEVLSLERKKKALKREIEGLNNTRTTAKRSVQVDEVVQTAKNKDGSERELPDIQE